MAWFTREKPGMDEGSGEGEKRLRTEGLWLKCESCGQIIWKKALDENLQCCPKCEFHFRIDARTRLGMLFDDGFEEFDTGMTSCDPLRSGRCLSRQAGHRTGSHPALRCAAFGLRRARRPAREYLRHGVEVHGRQHGRGGGRKNHPRRGTFRRNPRAAGHHFRLGRRAHAGRHHQPDAARQDFGGVDAPGRSPRSLHQRDDRSDLGRRHRQLRHAGRPEHRRAGRADRLRRPARDRADHPPETSRRFPAQRVPAGARISGRRGQTFGYEGVHRPRSDSSAIK